MTFYAGARFANNQLKGDPDGAGYMESVAQFGNPEKYQNSFVRFMISNPRAIYVRMGKNLRNFENLVNSGTILNLWDYVMLLAFSSLLLLARPPSLPTIPLFGYMTLLLMASPYFIVFHLDLRYSLMFVLMLVLWTVVATLLFWTWVGKELQIGPMWKILCILPAIGLIILCHARVESALSTAKSDKVNLLPWRQLANSFRANVGPGGTPVVAWISADGTVYSGGDFLWFSYFARTAVPWCGDPNCYAGNLFPRDRIYSFKGKALEYLWVPDERVRRLLHRTRCLYSTCQLLSWGCIPCCACRSPKRRKQVHRKGEKRDVSVSGRAPRANAPGSRRVARERMGGGRRRGSNRRENLDARDRDQRVALPPTVQAV